MSSPMENLLYEKWTRRLKKIDNFSIEPCNGRDEITCAIGRAASLVGLDRDGKSKQVGDPCEWRDVPDTSTWRWLPWSGKMIKKCVPCVEADAKKLYEFATGTGDYDPGRTRDGRSDRNVGLPALLQKDKTLLNIIVKHLPLIPLHEHIRNLAAELFPAGGRTSAQISVEGVRADDLAFQFYFLARLYQAGVAEGGRDKNWVAHGLATDPGRLGEAVELVRCMPITLGQKLETLSTLFDLPPPPLEPSPTPPVTKPLDTKAGDGARAGPSWRHAILAALLLLPSASATEGTSDNMSTQSQPDSTQLVLPSIPPPYEENIVTPNVFNIGLVANSVDTKVQHDHIQRCAERVAAIRKTLPEVRRFLKERIAEFQRVLGQNQEYSETEPLIKLSIELETIGEHILLQFLYQQKKLVENNPELQTWKIRGGYGYSLEEIEEQIGTLQLSLHGTKSGNGIDPKLLAKVISTAWHKSNFLSVDKDGMTILPFQDYALPLIGALLRTTHPTQDDIDKYYEIRYFLPIILNQVPPQQDEKDEDNIKSFIAKVAATGGIPNQNDVVDKIIKEEKLEDADYKKVSYAVGNFAERMKKMAMTEYIRNLIIEARACEKERKRLAELLSQATSFDAFVYNVGYIGIVCICILGTFLLMIYKFCKGIKGTFGHSVPVTSTENDVKINGVYHFHKDFRVSGTITTPDRMYFEVTKVHDGNKQIDGYIIMELKNQFRGGMKTVYQRSSDITKSFLVANLDINGGDMRYTMGNIEAYHPLPPKCQSAIDSLRLALSPTNPGPNLQHIRDMANVIRSEECRRRKEGYRDATGRCGICRRARSISKKCW
jgi:hypothetical protein